MPFNSIKPAIQNLESSFFISHAPIKPLFNSKISKTCPPHLLSYTCIIFINFFKFNIQFIVICVYITERWTFFHSNTLNWKFYYKKTFTFQKIVKFMCIIRGPENSFMKNKIRIWKMVNGRKNWFSFDLKYI